MHELGLAEGVLDAVQRRAAGRRVRGARVRAGVLLRISEPALGQAFATVAGGTVADGAHLDLVIEPVRLRCRSCRRTSTADDLVVACPECGDTDIVIEDGDGLVLESIQLADQPDTDRPDTDQPDPNHLDPDQPGPVQIAEVTHVPGNSRRDRRDPDGPS
jgi:hydrogenase nickel incorporation protein HypA/HybF